jgi:uncharacterized membrane protein YgdD (TMEM256/DUF423 family)
MPGMRDQRAVLVVAALMGLLAVGAGAFAAHGFSASGDARAAGLVETGSRYQMWHALAVLGIAALGLDDIGASLAFLAGCVLFSGSLYALAFGAPLWMALLTPIGGTLFLVGWLLVIFSLLRRGPMRR